MEKNLNLKDLFIRAYKRYGHLKGAPQTEEQIEGHLFLIESTLNPTEFKEAFPKWILENATFPTHLDLKGTIAPQVPKFTSEQLYEDELSNVQKAILTILTSHYGFIKYDRRTWDHKTMSEKDYQNLNTSNRFKIDKFYKDVEKFQFNNQMLIDGKPHDPKWYLDQNKFKIGAEL